MKAKPFSVQHRFLLLHTSTFALTIWFLAAALYINLRMRQEMERSINDAHAALLLDAEIEATQEDWIARLGQARSAAGQNSEKEFRATSAKLLALTERYLQLPLPREDRRAVESIRQQQSRLCADLSPFLASDPDPSAVARRLAEAQQIHTQIERLLHIIGQAQLQRLQDSTRQLREYTRTLYLLLIAGLLLATLVLLQFRRVHKREVWEPLEGLRRMVLEIRRGNLSPTGTVPGTIEFGTLVKGFLEMARELREMRDSLEENVRERTAKLETTQRELVQAAKLSALGQLVSGVAHEINNPLTSILGFSELALARPELDARLRPQLQTIREEALRLKGLVGNLSAFARGGPQRTARIDLREVLEGVVELRHYQLAASNIALHYDRPAQPVPVEADRDQLVQVFFNLVLNSEQAIQAHRGSGDIWLACGIQAERAWATVRDTGPGIPAEALECIFDPFFTTKPVGQGAGLGLSIAHGIIQRHQGNITAESVEGQGTTMRITLPLTSEAARRGGQPAGVMPPEPRAAAGQSALIIDDEPAITRLLSEYLESRGWNLVVLNDPTAVDSVLANQRFDLVICDLKMPGRNGLEILRLVREQQPELAGRFLLITGHLAESEARDAIELARVPVLRKPFTLERLAEVLRQLLLEPG